MVRVMGILVLVMALAACSSEKGSGNDGTQPVSGSEGTVVRKKIDKLDPGAFVEITIDLMKEKAKWEADWVKFMQQKRAEYFKAWGLTEKQYNEYPANNMAAMQRYLRDNPQANQAYMDASRTYNRQGP